MGGSGASFSCGALEVRRLEEPPPTPVTQSRSTYMYVTKMDPRPSLGREMGREARLPFVLRASRGCWRWEHCVAVMGPSHKREFGPVWDGGGIL